MATRTVSNSGASSNPDYNIDTNDGGVNDNTQRVVLANDITPPLPSGAATEATVGGISGASVLALTAGQKTMNSSFPVVLPSNQNVPVDVRIGSALATVGPGQSDGGTQRMIIASRPTATQTSVAAATSNTTLLAAALGRQGASVYNDSTSVLYLLSGGQIPSSTLFTVKMNPDDYWECPAGFNGIIKGIWVSAVGNARVTEYT